MGEDKGDIKSLLEDASEAAELLAECSRKGEFIRVESHLDADGIAAAGILGKALYRLESNFRIRIERWFDERIAGVIASENPGLTVFADMGSGYLDTLNKELPGRKVIILDHHQPLDVDSPESFLQVNPHFHGFEGSQDLSGAGVAYLMAKSLEKSNIDLAYLGIVGALADLQDKYEYRSLGAVNKMIVEDAVVAGSVETQIDLLLFGRETRPIHKALAYTTNPFMPGVSGEEDKALALLASLDIPVKNMEKWRALRDLSQDEKKKLSSALASQLASKDAMNLIGTVYTLKREEPWTPLRDAREFAMLLNATGRMGKSSVGVSICMGNRGAMLEHAEAVLEEYRQSIVKALNLLNENPERVEELDSIYVVHGDNLIDEKMISAISTILATNMPRSNKPIVAYSTIPDEGIIKVSARANELLIQSGLNIGEIIRMAAERNSGKGGGHDIAAGGQVPQDRKNDFIMLMNELVEENLERADLRSRDSPDI